MAVGAGGRELVSRAISLIYREGTGKWSRSLLAAKASNPARSRRPSRRVPYVRNREIPATSTGSCQGAPHAGPSCRCGFHAVRGSDSLDAVNCPSCDYANREAAKFCLECGHAFTRTCGSCGEALPQSARFCDECGSAVEAVADQASAPAAAAREPLAYTPKHLADKILQSKSALEGERKQVSVLFWQT